MGLTRSLIHGHQPVGIQGVAGQPAHQRSFTLRATGDANAVLVACEIVTNNYNSETIATETVDQGTPTGGTRFDISGPGTHVTVKGMSHTALAVMPLQPFNDIAGAVPFTAIGTVAAGKVVINFVNSTTGAALDLTAVAAGELIEVQIVYITSN